MITAMLSRFMILAFGTLYPAYASFKAVRTKDVKEYVKWMMYWIVFALFTFAETFTDVLLSFWVPFYYELKVALLFWLLSPANSGSTFLYRNFVHPAFLGREKEIDEMISQAKEQGYNTVLSLGAQSVAYAANVILQTAMKTIQFSGSTIAAGRPDGPNRASPTILDADTTPKAEDDDVNDESGIMQAQLLEEFVRRTSSSPNLRRSNRLRQQLF